MKTLAAPLIACVFFSACSRTGSDPSIRVGSKNFTEQVVLGEIIAQHLERTLHLPVDRRLNLGGTLLAHQALVSGEIDLYPEYTGTAWTAILKQPAEGLDAAAVLQRVQSEYRDRFHLAWLDPLGIDNTFAMIIRGEQARRLQIRSLSDAANADEAWTLGAGYEFEQRPDGLAALNDTYHLRFSSPPKSMDLGLLYQALENQQVDMIAANGTDGLLSKLDVTALTDDQHAFPPYQVSIVARDEILQKIPGLNEALLQLSQRFTNQTMQQLNYQVDGEHRPASEVAADFLKQAGL